MRFLLLTVTTILVSQVVVLSKPFVFKRSLGYLDAMVGMTFIGHAAWPIQEAPIYGLEYEPRTKIFRFLTVRKGNVAIVTYSNYWVHGFHLSGPWKIRCPSDMLMMGLSCYMDACSNLKMLCGKAGNGFRIVASKKKTVKPKPNPSTFLCPDGMHAQGVECYGAKCVNPTGIYCVRLDSLNYPGLRFEFPLLTVNNRLYTSAIFSSERGGYSWIMNGPIYAIGCLGNRYCDRMKLYSTLRGPDQMFTSDFDWVGPASGVGASLSCPPGKLIQGIRCTGDNCAKIHIRCASLQDDGRYIIDQNVEQRSNPFGTFWPYDTIGYCISGHYANRIDCLRSSCSVLIMGCVKVSIRE